MKDLNKAEEGIIEVLESITGNGSFATSGVVDFVLPGLEIKKYGEVALPLDATNAKKIIKYAQQAPYGKGSKTITDTKVRSAWEVDASQISFKNKAWDKCITDIEKSLKIGLGIERQKIKLSLYKLLIYQKGDFFLPHKDSEKEKGMFGTLVVGLPSNHSGGELLVNFDGRTETIDFSEPASNYQVPFAAFYADCEHEIKPIKKGYRICLVYNLVQTTKTKSISLAQVGEKDKVLVKHLKTWSKSPDNLPGVYLLDHQYTETNFSMESLKLHDIPRAIAFFNAAELANCYASLVLVTRHQSGSLEGVGYGYRGYYDDDEEDLSSGTMGEIFEDETYVSEIENQGKGAPSLGLINIELEDIISKKSFEEGEDDPIEKEAEGYTGNAGMTLDYWYHYGAIMFWPKDKHADLLMSRPKDVKLQWLKYYLKNDEGNKKETDKLIRGLVKSMKPEPVDDNIPAWKRQYWSQPDYDFNAFVDTLIKLIDIDFVKKECLETLVDVFNDINEKKWAKLVKTYKEDPIFATVFENAIEKDKLKSFSHYLKILKEINRKSVKLNAFVKKELTNIPKYLHEVKIQQLERLDNSYYSFRESTRADFIKNSIPMLLDFSLFMERDKTWLSECLKELTQAPYREFINTILAPIILKYKGEKGKFYKQIKEACIKDLKDRTAQIPEAPKDWSRPVPDTKGRGGYVWDTLKDFLESPTEQVFRYVKNESERKRFADIIKYVTIDLKMETIKDGRPYTLKITKTQAAFKLSLREYHKDLKLLAKLEK